MVDSAGNTEQILDELHQNVLKWDYYEDIVDDHILMQQRQRASRKRESAADADKQVDAEAQQETSTKSPIDDLKSVPVHFGSAKEYSDVFLPLFLVETKATIERAKTLEAVTTEPCKQTKAQMVGDFVRLELERPFRSHLMYSHADLVLLSQHPTANFAPPSQSPPSAPPDPKENHEAAANPDLDDLAKIHTLGMVESSVREVLTVKVCLDCDTPRGHIVAETINGFKTWHVTRITGLTTIHREFQALCAVPDLLLKDFVLNPRSLDEIPPDGQTPAEDDKRKAGPNGAAASDEDDLRLVVPGRLLDTLREEYNESQYEAIQACMRTKGITLVQGPPGTGKTTTILGVLSVILHASVRRSGANQTRQGKKSTDAPSSQDKAAPHRSSTSPPRRIRGALRHIEWLDTGKLVSVLRPDDPDVVRKEECRRLRRAQPWLFERDYKCWYDKVTWRPEDLAKPNQYPTAQQTDRVINMSKISEGSQPKKVLVCAPSNAAIDEIVRRLVHKGVYNKEGKRVIPQVVRVGPNSHPDILEHGLEHLTNLRLKAKADTSFSQRDAVRMGILSEARVVCATLSVCGGRDLTSFADGFDTVIIDEASQGVEMSVLIPFKLGARRVILVGDHRQLPATVFSKICEEHGYNRSLFQRLLEGHYPVTLLSVQYRMHPTIAEFPSKEFYDEQLNNAPNIDELVKAPPWYCVPALQPVVFFHVKTREQAEGSSLVNPEEADFVVQIFLTLTQMISEFDWRKKLAVVTPYAEQVRLIRQKFRDVLGTRSTAPLPIEVNTVDGFQGREKDCVIFSAVRGHSKKKTIGFVADTRRMNVALTRARFNLWVVANAETLVINPHWRTFIRTQQNQGRFLRVTPPSEKFLAKYIRGWYKRTPDAPWRPSDVSFLRQLDEGEDDKILEEARKEFDIQAVLQRFREEDEGNDLRDGAEEIEPDDVWKRLTESALAEQEQSAEAEAAAEQDIDANQGNEAKRKRQKSREASDAMVDVEYTAERGGGNLEDAIEQPEE